MARETTDEEQRSWKQHQRRKLGIVSPQEEEEEEEDKEEKRGKRLTPRTRKGDDLSSLDERDRETCHRETISSLYFKGKGTSATVRKEKLESFAVFGPT